MNLRNVIPCCSTALVMPKLNWFMISRIWRFITLTMDFVKFAWQRASTIAVVDHCCGCTLNKQSRTKQGTVVTGWLVSHWTVKSSIYVFWLAMAQFMSVFIHDFVECGRSHIKCLFLPLNSLSSDAWTWHTFIFLNLFHTSIFDQLVGFYQNNYYYSCPQGPWVI